MCGPPRPGVANRPSSGACCVGLGQGQRGAHRRGSRGQRRVTYQRTRLIKPRSVSYGKAAVMRARIAAPSITHSSNKAWLTGDFGPSNVALLVWQWVFECCRVDVGRKPREKSKIDQTLRSGSFEFDLCQKSRGSSPKRTNSIPASPSNSHSCSVRKFVFFMRHTMFSPRFLRVSQCLSFSSVPGSEFIISEQNALVLVCVASRREQTS